MQEGLAGSPVSFGADVAIAFLIKSLLKGSNGNAVTLPCTGGMHVCTIDTDIKTTARNHNIVLTGWRNESGA
jgi:hypothetical protein